MTDIKEKDILRERLELAIEEFKNSKLISKAQILSLESTLGENIFTSNRKIEYFTDNQSSVGVQYVVDELTRKLNQVNAELVRNPEEVLDDLSSFNASLSILKQNINKLISEIDTTKLDMLLSDKYGMIYEHIDGIDTLSDIRSKDFISTLIKHNDYLLTICKLSGSEYETTFKKMLDILTELTDGIVGNEIPEYIPMPIWSMFLNIIDSKESGKTIFDPLPTTLRTISLYDIKNIISNIGTVNIYIDGILEHGRSFFNGYTGYKNFKETLENISIDQYSNLLRNIGFFMEKDNGNRDKSLDAILDTLLK